MDRKEAIEIVRKNYPHVGISDSEFESALRELVPELKESEDERTRKDLIAFICQFAPEHLKTEYVAYLERQKEHFRDDTKMVEQQPADSDVIKGGDFISDGKRVFLVLANVKERNLGETDSTFCEGHILGVDGVVYCNGDNFKKFKRATSNERAKFIHDLKVGVELKEQPAEWSVEDRKMLDAIIKRYSFPIETDFSVFVGEDNLKDMREELGWLKSLRPQPKVEREPMEIKYGGRIYQVHGMRALPGGASGYIIEDEPGHYDCIMNPEEVLGGGYGVKQNGSPYPTKEATFDEPHWKPSEEQIGALERAIVKTHTVDDIGILAELRDNLKKL